MNKEERRILVIHNPIAGQRNQKRLKIALAALEQHATLLNVVETRHAGDGRIRVKEALEGAQTYDIIAAAGGDGTIAEVATGLMNSDVPLLVLPLGTANVFARELGLGTSMKRIAAQIHTLQPKQIYTGKLPDRRFIMMVGGGIDSLAVAALNTDLKRKIGAAAYVIAAFNALKEMKSLKFNVTVNDQSYNCTNVIVTKGCLYGGPFTLCKEAKLEDPQLHVIMMHKSGFWALLRYGLALVLGRITSLKDVDVVSTTQVTIKSEHPLPLQVDGDLLGFTPCEISIDPNPLTVLAPPRNHV